MCIRVCACANADDTTDEYVYIDSDTTPSKTEGVEKKDEKNREKNTSIVLDFAITIYFTIKFVLFFSRSIRIDRNALREKKPR